MLKQHYGRRHILLGISRRVTPLQGGNPLTGLCGKWLNDVAVFIVSTVYIAILARLKNYLVGSY